MTKHPEIYYLFDEQSSTVFWTLDEDKKDEALNLIFLGSSLNPNKKMAVAAFIKGSGRQYGYKIKELP